MLNPIPKFVHFWDYLNFGALLIFSYGQFVRTCALSIGYMLVNIELAKFVSIKIYLVVKLWHKEGQPPLWNLSCKNRVTPVSIQDGVLHGITFAVIST